MANEASHLARQDMRDALARNPAVVAGMVLQARRNRKAAQEAFVFVEGPSDRNAYAPFAGDHTTFIVAHGRENVGSCVRMVEAQKANGVYGIEDADCDRSLGKSPESNRVFLTDGHDMEAMIVRSPALERVLRELGDVNLTARFEEAHGPVRGTLLAAARPLGVAKYLKLTGELKGVDISTRTLPYAKFIDSQTLEVLPDRLCAYLASTSGGRTSESDVVRLLQTTDLSQTDDWDVCRGHDLVAFLAIGLGKALGRRVVSIRDVEQSLRLAFDSMAFCKTNLCASIVSCEAADPDGLTVLSDGVRVVSDALRSHGG